MRQAILDEVRDWKKLDDELEIRKAVRKMRMLYAHLLMYHLKMQEVNSDSGSIEKPMPFKEINRK
jgi:hypothetical protein